MVPNIFHFPSVNSVNFCRIGLSQIMLHHFKVMKHVDTCNSVIPHTQLLYFHRLFYFVVMLLVQLITSLLILVLFTWDAEWKFDRNLLTTPCWKEEIDHVSVVALQKYHVTISHETQQDLCLLPIWEVNTCAAPPHTQNSIPVHCKKTTKFIFL